MVQVPDNLPILLAPTTTSTAADGSTTTTKKAFILEVNQPASSLAGKDTQQNLTDTPLDFAANPSKAPVTTSESAAVIDISATGSTTASPPAATATVPRRTQTDVPAFILRNLEQQAARVLNSGPKQYWKATSAQNTVDNVTVSLDTRNNTMLQQNATEAVTKSTRTTTESSLVNMSVPDTKSRAPTTQTFKPFVKRQANDIDQAQHQQLKKVSSSTAKTFRPFVKRSPANNTIAEQQQPVNVTTQSTSKVVDQTTSTLSNKSASANIPVKVPLFAAVKRDADNKALASSNKQMDESAKTVLTTAKPEGINMAVQGVLNTTIQVLDDFVNRFILDTSTGSSQSNKFDVNSTNKISPAAAKTVPKPIQSIPSNMSGGQQDTIVLGKDSGSESKKQSGTANTTLSSTAQGIPLKTPPKMTYNQMQAVQSQLDVTKLPVAKAHFVSVNVPTSNVGQEGKRMKSVTAVKSQDTAGTLTVSQDREGKAHQQSSNTSPVSAAVKNVGVQRVQQMPKDPKRAAATDASTLRFKPVLTSNSTMSKGTQEYMSKYADKCDAPFTSPGQLDASNSTNSMPVASSHGSSSNFLTSLREFRSGPKLQDTSAADKPSKVKENPVDVKGEVTKRASSATRKVVSLNDVLAKKKATETSERSYGNSPMPRFDEQDMRRETTNTRNVRVMEKETLKGTFPLRSVELPRAMESPQSLSSLPKMPEASILRNDTVTTQPQPKIHYWDDDPDEEQVATETNGEYSHTRMGTRSNHQVVPVSQKEDHLVSLYTEFSFHFGIFIFIRLIASCISITITQSLLEKRIKELEERNTNQANALKAQSALAPLRRVQQPQRLRPAPIIDEFKGIAVHGGSLKTWSFVHPSLERVRLLLQTDGRPLSAEVALWQGPDSTPHKMRVYSDDGHERPFSTVIQTPGSPNTVAIRNTGLMEFPLAALVRGINSIDVKASSAMQLSRGKPPVTIQGGSLRTFFFKPMVQSVQVFLTTDGRPLNARIELLQGPTNNKQVVDVYTDNGTDRPFSMVIETPGNGESTCLLPRFAW